MAALYVRLRFPDCGVDRNLNCLAARPYVTPSLGRFARSSNLVLIDIWGDALNDGFGAPKYSSTLLIGLLLRRWETGDGESLAAGVNLAPVEVQ
jgi:hypothetical protein